MTIMSAKKTLNMRKLRLFYDFMIEHGAWEEYKEGVRDDKDREDYPLDMTNPDEWIASAFNWGKSTSGYEYWDDLDDIWNAELH